MADESKSEKEKLTGAWVLENLAKPYEEDEAPEVEVTAEEFEEIWNRLSAGMRWVSQGRLRVHLKGGWMVWVIMPAGLDRMRVTGRR